jgi:hypothetical protein
MLSLNYNTKAGLWVTYFFCPLEQEFCSGQRSVLRKGFILCPEHIFQAPEFACLLLVNRGKFLEKRRGKSVSPDFGI